MRRMLGPATRRGRRVGVILSAGLCLALPLAILGVPAVSASADSRASARRTAAPVTTLTAAAFLAGRSSLDPSVITFGDDEVPDGVVAFGIPTAGDAQALASSARFVSPVPGPITSAFGPRFHPILHYVRNHNGADMTAACGTPVVAMTDGKVTRSGVAGGYGNLVEIDHGLIDGKRMVTHYAHLSVLGARVGQQVSKGQQIGLSGTTGLSTGCHLHFEVLVNGAYVNPAAVLAGAPYTRLDIPMAVVAQPTALAAETPLPSATPALSPEPTASATPTPTPTLTPTPTPTPQASANATASASPTPTASASSSASASPTATATVSPSATAKATATATAKATASTTAPAATGQPTPTAQAAASSAADADEESDA